MSDSYNNSTNVMEFADLTRKVLATEVSSLDELSKLTDSIKARLTEIYANKFPKKCNTCGKIYNSMEEYIKETYDPEMGSSVYSQRKNKVHQYKNCVCGSTLAVVLVNRRDTSEFGEARRRLFDICVEKLVSATGEERELIVRSTRELFRQIIDKQIEENGLSA